MLLPRSGLSVSWTLLLWAEGPGSGAGLSSAWFEGQLAYLPALRSLGSSGFG